MGRPKGSVNNVSVCLTDETFKLLTTTARLLATPQVSVGELISEGFWTVTRYTERPENMVRRLRRELVRYICSERNLSEFSDKCDRLLCRSEHEFEQWSRHRKYKLKR